MSFLFRMASRMRPSTTEEVVRSIKDSFLALATNTSARVNLFSRLWNEALPLLDVVRLIRDEIEQRAYAFLMIPETRHRSFPWLQPFIGSRRGWEKHLILAAIALWDGEAEPNQEQVLQIALEICKEDVLSLFVQNLPSLGWEVRKDLANCWCILLGQKDDENYCCVKYIEDHVELLDFLVGCYKNLDVALNSGSMLRECIKYPTLAKYILESNSFELFFEYVELPNFDIASDALNTFKDLLTKHETVVSEFLGSHYQKFFEHYTRILTSNNYVTRRQSVKFLSEFLLEASNSKIMKRFIMEVHFLNIMIGLLKDSSKNIRICAFHVFKVFVANPNKPRSIVEALRDNRRELLKLLHNLPASKGEDELDEERDLIIQAIEKL